MTVDFEALLHVERTIILDGAMGTELERRGVPGGCKANLQSPGEVLNVHLDYFGAGSNAAITNTLTMNRIYIESHGLDVDVTEVNVSGARLARLAAGQRGYVLGNLSSTGQLLEPYGDYTEKQVVGAFREQAAALQQGGVDGFIIETMIDLREAACALGACKAESSLPVIVMIAFETEANGGRTVMGNSVMDCVHRLTDEGADAMGANCGRVDPLQMAQIVSAFRARTTLPIGAEPNAGMPHLRDGRTTFDMSPEAFAADTSRCVSAGAAIVGGCCGTTPEHIRRLSQKLSTSGC